MELDIKDGSKASMWYFIMHSWESKQETKLVAGTRVFQHVWMDVI